MENKKIGLILAFKSTNFGCQLQAFATQHIIELLGFETYILDFSRKNMSFDSINFSYGIIQYLYASRLERRIRYKTRETITNPIFRQNKSRRKELSQAFIQKYLHNIVNFDSYKKLKKYTTDFYACLIGSDQKWLPGFCYDKISSLSFVSEGCRRISYATSLGVSKYPRYCWGASRKVWDKFDYLSVREKQGEDIVNEICNNNRCYKVLDPTYLLSKKQWETIIPIKRKITSRYILCYFLGNDDNAKIYAREYAIKHNLKIVSILNDESFTELDLSFADEVLSNVSPEDFINLIRGAECVFTDSFHGMTFSIINRIQFFVFYRKRSDAKLNRNSRIDNILHLFNLDKRLIKDTSNKIINEESIEIDYEKIDSILQSERDRSLSYLRTSLSI